MNRLKGAKDGSDHEQIEAQLTARIEQWQAVIDDVKLQIHLSAREVRERVEPVLQKVEQQLQHARAQLRHLEETVDHDMRSKTHHSVQDSLHGVKTWFGHVRQAIDRPEET